MTEESLIVMRNFVEREGVRAALKNIALLGRIRAATDVREIGIKPYRIILIGEREIHSADTMTFLSRELNSPIVAFIDEVTPYTAHCLQKFPIHGLFHRNDSLDQLTLGVQYVAAGGTALHRDFGNDMRQLFNLRKDHLAVSRSQAAHFGLTRRESEVLSLAMRDCANSEIADILFIQTCTVKSHLHSAFAKLKVRGRTQAAEKLRSSMHEFATLRTDPRRSTGGAVDAPIVG